MGRKQNLEELIRRSCELIQAYQRKIQVSSDPTEDLRSRDEIKRQRDIIWELLPEYIPLCMAPDAAPQDIVEIIISQFPPHLLAPLYVKSLLSRQSPEEFVEFCIDLLKGEGYRIREDRQAAVRIAVMEKRPHETGRWLLHFVHFADPDAGVRQEQIMQQNLESLAERVGFDVYLIVTKARFHPRVHQIFQRGIAGKPVAYWDEPIIVNKLSNNPSLWQQYVGPYQLTQQSPRLSARYQLLDDDLFKRHGYVLPRVFYEGSRPTWAEIQADLDVRRHVYFEGQSVTYRDFFATVVRRTAGARGYVSFFLLAAEAGAGKTTALLRIGYDLYRQGEAGERSTHTVLRLRETKSPEALPLIEWYKETQKPIYVLMDFHDVAAQTRRLRGMLSELRLERVSVTIIAAARANEWEQVRGWSKVRGAGIVPEDTVHLTRLSSDEIDQVISLLERHEIVPPLDAQARERMKADFVTKSDRQLFVALMEITHGEPFEEILLDEYYNLPEMAQAAYRYVCLLSAYEILLPAKMLVAILGLGGREDLLESVLVPAQGVIVIEDMDRIDCLRARHPRIAHVLKKRVRLLHIDRGLREMASDIVKATAYYKGNDRYIVLKLLLGLLTDPAYPKTEGKELVRGLMDDHSEKIAGMLYRAKVEGRYIELAEWGRLYYELGEFLKDKECLDYALDIAPEDDLDRLYYYYGRVLRELRDPHAAKYFELAWQSDAENVELLHDYAKLRIGMGDLERAANLLERALSVDPENKVCRKTYRILLDRLQAEQKYDRLVQVCETGLKQNPQNAQTLYRLATALQRMGRHRDAVRRFRALLEIEDDHIVAMKDCAFSLGVLGPAYYSEAAELYQSAIEKHTRRDLLWAQLRNDYALLLVQMGTEYHSQAEALWAEATKGCPDFVWAWVNLGEHLFRNKRQYKRAMELFRRALVVAGKKRTAKLSSAVRDRLCPTVEALGDEVGQAEYAALLQEVDSPEPLLAALLSE